ncbi:MAG: HAD family phosphatase [Saccharofermentans sp.]|nr:HAD family phosphatase [Saccharofermentans sp.]
MQEQFKGFVFDMDGLLLDSERAVLRSWEQIGYENNLEGITEFALSVIGQNSEATNKRFIERYGDELPVEQFRQQTRDRFRQMLSKGQIHLKPYAMDILKALKAKGYKVALASSTSRASVVHEMDVLGTLPFFDVLVCGDQVTRSKPDPEIFLMACEGLGLEPSSCCGFEDSYNGVKACKAAGLYTVMVPDLLPSNEETDKLADLIVPDLSKAMEALGLA